MNSQNTNTPVNFGHLVNGKLGYRLPPDMLEKQLSANIVLAEVSSFYFISANADFRTGKIKWKQYCISNRIE